MQIELEELKHKINNSKYYGTDVWRDILDMANDCESKGVEWTPCSERLPNENDDYLVTLENGVVKTLGYSTTQRTTYPKGFYHIKDGFSWRQKQNPVVAWMPLPEPWGGADDE